MDIHVVLCSCPDRGTAERLAESLVRAGLAACASLVPGVRSVYRWEGRIETAEEVLLVLKTHASRVPELTDRIREAHPYELPEVLAVQAAGGLPAYLAWVAEETRRSD